MKDDRYSGVIIAQGPHPGQDVRDGGDMIGTEDVDQPVKVAPKFFPVISDIGQAVGGLAGTLDNDPILLLAKLRGLEPDRALFFIDQPFALSSATTEST